MVSAMFDFEKQNRAHQRMDTIWIQFFCSSHEAVDYLCNFAATPLFDKVYCLRIKWLQAKDNKHQY